MARYTDESRERVRDAVDFAELVGARTELRRAGVARLEGLCPFHDERSPSFGINPTEKVYYCFGCGAGGDVFRFVMDTEGLNFGQALEALAERYRVPLEREAEDPRDAERRQKRERLLALLERTAAYYVRVLWESPDAEAARAYLQSRGLEESALRAYRVGYAPDTWDRVLLGSRKAGYSEGEIVAAGLASRTQRGTLIDRFRGRITFPLADERGRVLGFGARAMKPDDKPKYLNTSENDLFHKGRIVYGADLARAPAARAGRVVLVEGYTDVIALHQAGVPEVVAQMGTALTDQQVDAIARLAPKALFCQDPDRAGQESVAKGIAALRTHNKSRTTRGVEFRIVRLPAGQDPADVAQTAGGEALRGLLDKAIPIEKFEVERALEQPDASADEILAVVAPIIAPLPASTLKAELVQIVSGRLGMGENLVNEALRQPFTAGSRDDLRGGGMPGRGGNPPRSGWSSRGAANDARGTHGGGQHGTGGAPQRGASGGSQTHRPGAPTGDVGPAHGAPQRPGGPGAPAGGAAGGGASPRPGATTGGGQGMADGGGVARPGAPADGGAGAAGGGGSWSGGAAHAEHGTGGAGQLAQPGVPADGRAGAAGGGQAARPNAPAHGGAGGGGWPGAHTGGSDPQWTGGGATGAPAGESHPSGGQPAAGDASRGGPGSGVPAGGQQAAPGGAQGPSGVPEDPFPDGPPPPEWDGFSGGDEFDPGAMGPPQTEWDAGAAEPAPPGPPPAWEQSAPPAWEQQPPRQQGPPEEWRRQREWQSRGGRRDGQRGGGRYRGGGGRDRYGRNDPVPDPVDTQFALNRGQRQEYTFLAFCIALPEDGEKRLEALDVEDYFAAPATRRAAAYLRGRLRSPTAHLPAGDEALARLVAELVVRSGQLEATSATFDLEALQLELHRLDRRISSARVSGGTGVHELAVQRQRVLDEIRHKLA